MRRIAVISALVLLPAVVLPGDVAVSAAEAAKAKGDAVKRGAGRETKRLVGTWECVSERPPAGIRIVKHFTPTHFTCVHYDRATNVPKVTIGGTWTRDDEVYKEKVDFASDGHKHLRGKEFAFSMTIKRGEFKLKAAKGSGIVVNETWKKVKPQDAPAGAGVPADARTSAPAVSDAKAIRNQAEALEEARQVDLPLLAGADKIVIEESGPGGRRVVIDDRDDIRRFLAALTIESVTPSAGEQAAQISVFKGERLLRKIWIYKSGEWGFQRPGVSPSTGRSAGLWRFVEDHL